MVVFIINATPRATPHSASIPIRPEKPCEEKIVAASASDADVGDEVAVASACRVETHNTNDASMQQTHWQSSAVIPEKDKRAYRQGEDASARSGLQTGLPPSFFPSPQTSVQRVILLGTAQNTSCRVRQKTPARPEPGQTIYRVQG